MAIKRRRHAPSSRTHRIANAVNPVAPNKVRRAAVIGAGTIGAGWAALFLANDIAVAAYDPAPEAETRLRAWIARAWPALRDLGLAGEGEPGAVTVHGTVEAAVEGAEFVQENGPEDEAGKAKLLAQIDAALPPDVVIASSTSAFLVSDLQGECRHPERLVLGHPFNPPHLVPLVEVAGGRQTAGWAVDWAMDFYRRIGQIPIRLEREIYRHVANRLQSVVWNEAVRLLEMGIASPADIDKAVAFGPGLRWAFMGPLLTHHLAGGAGGLEKALTMFGDPAGGAPDDIRRAAPSEAVKAALLEDLDAITGGRSIEDLEKARDRTLVAIRKAVASWAQSWDDPS